MAESAIVEPGRYPHGDLPPNARLGDGTIVTGGRAFLRFRSTREDALVVGSNCTLDGVSFAVGRQGRLTIGDCCLLTGCVLLAETDVTIGSYVSIGWNVTVADSDFHPIDPELRRADTVACSPIGDGRRPAIVCRPIVIEDDVYVGPNAAILKGVRIGAGSWIEAGSLVTRDVPPRSRVIGNPARVAGSV
jgi:acetyltransferase-like isoleucine patch superfamily enzyme